MNKEKIFKLLKSKIGVGVISGVLCFATGYIMSSDSITIESLKIEKSDLISDYETQLENKDIKIKELQSKVDEAKPWFDKEENERKAEEVKLAQDKAQKEEEEQKQKEVEEQQREIAQEEARKKYEEEEANKGVNANIIKSSVNTIVKKELSDKITNTTLDSLEVNENLGTESNRDVIVLINLSWSTQSLEKTTRKILETYSDHLAATISSQLADGSEIALFWEAEYTGLDIKHSYYIENGNAYKQ